MSCEKHEWRHKPYTGIYTDMVCIRCGLTGVLLTPDAMLYPPLEEKDSGSTAQR